MRAPLTALSILTFAATAACGADGQDPDGGNETEVITAVALTFTPAGGGAPAVFEFDDPDGDGGDAPTVDPIDLLAGSYTLTVVFENRLEDPPEDITEEIADESDEHQIFLTGSAVDGPAATNAGAPLAHAYEDQDAGGLPIGLTNSIEAVAGNGDLIVTLRHLPPVNDEPVKSSTLAGDVARGGFSSIGGSSDAQVTFSVTVQ